MSQNFLSAISRPLHGISLKYFQTIIVKDPVCTYLASSATELSISGAASLASVAGAGLDWVRVGEMASGVTLSRDGASLMVGGGPSKYIVVPSTTYD